jgi:hypothetical protein
MQYYSFISWSYIFVAILVLYTNEKDYFQKLKFLNYNAHVQKLIFIILLE